jgi:hypothetical protein
MTPWLRILEEHACHRPNKTSPWLLRWSLYFRLVYGPTIFNVDTYAQKAPTLDLPECNTHHVEHFPYQRPNLLTIHEPSNQKYGHGHYYIRSEFSSHTRCGSFPRLPESRFRVCARTFTFPSTRPRYDCFDSSYVPDERQKTTHHVCWVITPSCSLLRSLGHFYAPSASASRLDLD